MSKSKKRTKRQPKKKLSKASSKTSADASSTPVKNTNKRLSRKSTIKKKTVKDDSVCNEDLLRYDAELTMEEQKLTETFKKYRVIVPSLEEILEEQEEIRQYKEQIQRALKLKKPNFTELTTPINVRRSNRIRKQPPSIQELDCKNLTQKEITKHFKNYMPMDKNISKEKFLSWKRNHLKKNAISQHMSNYDLKYSASSMAFTFDQIDHMATLMNEYFNSKDIDIHIDMPYLFQTLIPELCLKIFMSVHHMDKQQAKSFFEKCSVP